MTPSARQGINLQAMRILLLNLASRVQEELPAVVCSIAGEDNAAVFNTPEDAMAALRQPEAPFDLAIIGDDNGERLIASYHALFATGRLPPTLIVSACQSVETAVCLLKLGTDDFILTESEIPWASRLLEAAATAHQARTKPLREHLDTELRDSQQRLAQIVDGSSVATFVIDHAHRVTNWNRACEALTGIESSRVVGTREHWRAFYQYERPCMADLVIDGAIEARVAEYYGGKGSRRSRVLAGTYEAEDFFPNFGDNGRWLYFTAAPLKDRSGRIIGAIETLQDITEQKTARDALRESETLLRQIIQCSSVATFVINREHEITHWNRACEILLGRNAENTIGTRTLPQMVYHHDRPLLADLVLDGAAENMIAHYYDGRYRKSSLIDGVFEVEDRFPDLPGGERWIHFAAAPLHDNVGKTIGAIETLIDITERKRAEERMQESEQHLAQIIDASAVATFVIDREHRVTHWNRACAAMTGLPADELIGTCDQWRAFYPSERPCMADLVLDGAVEERLAGYYKNKKLHRSPVIDDGFEAEDFFPNFGSSGRWLYFTAAPLRNGHGDVVGAIETLQDLTEQKRAEENLRTSEERYRLLSITDGMTGLFNARHFATRLREEMDRCQRYQHPLALMVLDVDNFKQFNDSHGHVQGDQVLIQLAACINHCLRSTDQAFRYGGEEFVALLPETDLDNAEAAAERVRAMFANADICPTAEQTVRCTASIGVTTFIPGESPRDFVARADSGTYEAKRLGKNRVIRITPKTADLPN
jgi:diguanylate cyclase (GGDEF)-like protein/PAS domain S-box-containing protein